MRRPRQHRGGNKTHFPEASTLPKGAPWERFAACPACGEPLTRRHRQACRALAGLLVEQRSGR